MLPCYPHSGEYRHKEVYDFCLKRDCYEKTKALLVEGVRKMVMAIPFYVRLHRRTAIYVVPEFSVCKQ